MAIIPGTTRFIGISPEVDLTEKKSAQINSKSEPYTMADISESVSGTSIQTVRNGLTAEGTSDATTSVMEYAVNVFTTATPSDDSTKLPQPTTGRTTKIINNSSRIMRVYPSNVGGKINNLSIDEPILIPNDGKVYEFICTLNPLPGNWNTVSAPATAQKVFAEIEVSHTSGAVTTLMGTKTATLQTGFPTFTYDGSGNLVLTGDQITELLPTTLIKTKIYTNVLDSDLSGDEVYFEMRTNNKTVPPGLNQSIVSILDFGLGNGQQAPVATLNVPANVGDTGTYFREDVLRFGNYYQIGAIDNVAWAGSGYYYYFIFSIPASAATKTYKFQIMLETL